MNDFTKEELEYMADCIEGEIKYYGADHVGHAARDKLQSMIDNYCEHEWKLTFSGSIIKGIYCQKCAIKLKGS